MRRLRNAVTVLVVAMMAFSVSVFASDEPPPTSRHCAWHQRVSHLKQPLPNQPAMGLKAGTRSILNPDPATVKIIPTWARFCPCGAVSPLPSCCCPLRYGRC